ncbi:MAG: hypothetical protein COA42_21580 [Alteromonadaceae bacterium]|nr:MAG: hypothetical protein COA42_21580 [Alteromonadaceae bacterium]
MKVKLASKSEIERFNSNRFKADLNTSLGAGLNRLAIQQDIKESALEHRISGSVGASWLMRHFNKSFGNDGRSRKQHLLSAITWMSQVPLGAIYCASSKDNYWQAAGWDISTQAYESMLRSCDFDPDNFFNLIRDCLKWGVLSRGAEDPLSKLEKYDGSDFLFPDKINLDKFGYEYYNSVGSTFKKIRIANGFLIESIAAILGVTPEKYLRIESPRFGDTFDQSFAFRSVFIFNLQDNSSVFLEEMQKYRGMLLSRKIQELRTRVFECYQELHPLDYKEFMNCVVAKRRCATRFSKGRSFTFHDAKSTTDDLTGQPALTQEERKARLLDLFHLNDPTSKK